MYKKLEVDFEIDEHIADSIDGFVNEINNRGGDLADCYKAEIDSGLKYCMLTDEQIEILRNYYVRRSLREQIAEGRE